MKRGFLAAAGLFLWLSCGGEEAPVDPRFALMESARVTLEEARGHAAAGRPDVYREGLFRARGLALEALDTPGGFPIRDIHNFLANLYFELGRVEPPFLIKALRYAEKAREDAPGWPLPDFNLGLTLAAMGFFTDAAEAFERVRRAERLPPDIVAQAVHNLVSVLVDDARRLLITGRPGAAGAARLVLERAFALQAEGPSAEAVDRALTDLNKVYERQAREAGEAKDLLTLARIHAENGFFPSADVALTKARNEQGRSEGLRWVEARYVEELTDTEESRERARFHYEEMIGRGERVPQALAGLARVLARDGRADEAIRRLSGFPDPTVEVRQVHLELLLRKIAGLPADDAAAAAPLWATVDDLLLGTLTPEDRLDILLLGMNVALGRKDEQRLERWILEFKRRQPADPRALFFEARLLDLRKAPLEEQERTDGR